MGKHYVDYAAQCPFYKAEDRDIIYCEGVTDKSVIQLAFSGSAAAYKNKFCCENWKRCLIASALQSKYN